MNENSGKKVLIKDIVIPAGTIFMQAPVKTERFGDDHIECFVGLTKDTSGSFTYDISDDKDKLKEYFVDLI